MKPLFTAVALSLCVHAVIAAGLIACLEWAPRPDVLATLDLSSVELSFAEEVQDTAAVAPMPPSAGRRVPTPPQEERPPEAKLEKPLPPEAGEIRFPEPREDARLKPKDAKDRKDVRRETRDANPVSSPAVAPRQAKLDAPQKPRRNIRPDYPKGARQRGEQGDVVLEIRVNADGTVDGVSIAVSSGFAELDEAAVRAAKAARFSPARSGREPVASTARLKLQFRLK